jgi:hypothetical protein
VTVNRKAPLSGELAIRKNPLTRTATPPLPILKISSSRPGVANAAHVSDRQHVNTAVIQKHHIGPLAGRLFV